jgi:hypothetical protein
MDYAITNIVLERVTLESNLALQATFENSTAVYVNPDTNVSGSMSFTSNTLSLSTEQFIEGSQSGKKLANDQTRFLKISNFISGSWTIVFWYYSKILANTNSASGDYVQIMDQDKYYTTTSWRMYFLSGSNKLGMYYNAEYPTDVPTSNLQNKWTLIALTSDNYMKVKTADGVDDYYNTLGGSYDADNSTAGDGITFGADNNWAPNQDSYYDDIRVYNTVLTNTQLNSIFSEHVS